MKVSKETRENRKKQTAEVFTPKELVEEMLDNLPTNSWEEDKTFCDPAAGNGNFLIEVYKWKVEKYNHDPTIALESIYACELMKDNTAEMKIRFMKMALSYGVRGFDIKRILTKNIICHDALTYHFDFDDIIITAKHSKNGVITHLKDSNGNWYDKAYLIESIKNGGHYNVKGTDIVISGNHLITKKNNTVEDNIGNLPEEEYENSKI